MSLDIDWPLLSSLPNADSSSLSASFITLLNRTLSTVNRPSFLGPIEVTHFDFGDVAPEVEIKDVGDVWRAFEEDEDEEEEEDGAGGEWDGRGDRGWEGSAAASSQPVRRRRNQIPDETIGGEDWDYIHRKTAKSYPKINHLPGATGSYYPDEEDDEAASVFSGMMSPRQSMQRFAGAGIGIGLGAGMGVNLGVRMNSGLLTPGLNGINPSLFSQTLSAPHPLRPLRPQARQRDSRTPELTTPVPESPVSETPPPDTTSSFLPSIQLLLHLSHSPNITLTLLTSLQINYPSPSFMSLPLKLSITGFTLSADIVLAFEGPKRRVHISLIDEHDPFTPSPSLSHGGGGSSTTPSLPSTPGQPHVPLKGFAPIHPPPPPEPPKPIGQRLLPNLMIESEIGHADAHVLRNVGKVEKFIGDVVRKFLCDELVFPNYQTVAM